ncbi:ABC transporter permease [Vallitalea maricola]|uniref:Sugar ABC transporter permease n=1 Tax=Vallitalea maricola TaxID=3074433 RepID=A0ACB5UP72_9FIRM|nr:sugar ABC transporter permease [Vallitalea sp. AN17-2]
MKKLKKHLKYYPLYLMMLPGFIIVLCMRYLPMGGIIIAFKDMNYADGLFGSPWVGLRNFEFLFKTNDALLITRNTLLYNLVFIFLGLFLAVAFAIALSEIRNRFAAKVYQSLFFFPYFLSMVVVAYMVLAFLGMENGFLNTKMLTALGIDKINFYAEPKYWPLILTFVNTWKYLGYSTVVYLAAILGIAPELYEAATIDGANKWKQIKYITLPGIKPIMIILTIMAIGKIFYSDFGLFYNVPMDSGALFPTTQVIDTFVYRAMMNLGDLGMAAAAGLYQSLVGFILVLTTNWIVKKIDSESALF